MPKTQNEMMTPKEMRTYLKIGRDKAYERLASQQVKAVKLGRRYLIPRRSLMEFIERNLIV